MAFVAKRSVADRRWPCVRDEAGRTARPQRPGPCVIQGPINIALQPCRVEARFFPPITNAIVFWEVNIAKRPFPRLDTLGANRPPQRRSTLEAYPASAEGATWEMTA